MTQQPPVLVDDRRVVGVLVRVDATDDVNGFLVEHAWNSLLR